MDKVLNLWQSMIKIPKWHVYTKPQQPVISCLSDNVSAEQILYHLDYSEDYKLKHQNELEIAYFSNHPFSIFATCTYYTASITTVIL